MKKLTPFGVREHGTKAPARCQAELTQHHFCQFLPKSGAGLTGDAVLGTLNSVEPSTTLQTKEGSPMADDPTTAPGNVVPLFSKAMLPKRITSASFARAMSVLNDCLRGSLRKDGPVERLFVQIHALLWTIAKQDSADDAVLQLSIALTELDEALARRAEAAIAAVEVERTASLERELGEIRAALDALRTAHAALEAVQRDTAATLEAERAARAAAERSRIDEIRAALATLRAEHTSAAQAVAQLAALAERAGAAHTAIDGLLDAVTTTAQTSTAPNLAALRAKLAGRLRTLESWLRGLDDDCLRVAAEELAEIPDVQELRAMQRTGGVRIPDHLQREVAAHLARRQQLEAYGATLVALKQPVEKEREEIQAILHAIEVLSKSHPDKTTLPAVPEYPEPEALDDASDRTGFDVAPTAASTEMVGSATAELSVQLAAVLYDIVHRNFGQDQRLILWVAKAAEAAGVLQRHGFTYWAFTKHVLSIEHKTLLDRYLRYKGTIGGNKSVTFFVRTEEPTPTEWEPLVTNAERDAFIAAFRARIAARAAVKARTTT